MLLFQANCGVLTVYFVVWPNRANENLRLMICDAIVLSVIFVNALDQLNILTVVNFCLGWLRDNYFLNIDMATLETWLS